MKAGQQRISRKMRRKAADAFEIKAFQRDSFNLRPKAQLSPTMSVRSTFVGDRCQKHNKDLQRGTERP
jgi:hypothetical protein